jgi:hypothetical protein
MIKALFPITAAATLALLLTVPPAVAALEAPSAAPAPGEPGLTRAEAVAKAEKLFARLDLNHDGKLDAADRALHFGEIFDQIDTNHDGSISRDEFIAAQMREPVPGGDRDDGPPPPPPPGMAPNGPPMGGDEHAHHHGPMDHPGEPGRGAMEMVGLILHTADPQHTGTVTHDAFIAATLVLFDKADTNHDGIMTPAEHKAAQAALRSRWHARMHDHDGRPGDGPPAGGPAGEPIGAPGDMPPPPSGHE